MRVIVDTNVPLVANDDAPQASDECLLACIDQIEKIIEQGIVVIDDGWHILGEYTNNLHSGGQPGLGDAFLKWILTNLGNPAHCERVAITPAGEGTVEENYEEFPDDPALRGFDPSDRKFVAVALAHQERPPILNAVDTDWWNYRDVLQRHDVKITFICPDAMS